MSRPLTSTRPTAFEARLKEELMAVAAERLEAPVRADVIRPVPFARRYRLPLAVGSVAVAAAALVAFPVLGDHGGSSPAYAVSRDADGTIRVKLFNPDGLPGVVRELHALGVKAAIVDVKPLGECPPNTPLPLGTDPSQWLMDSHDTHTLALRINSHTLPPGRTLLLAKPPGTAPGIASFGVSTVEKVPPCVSVVDYAGVTVDPGAGR